MGLSESIQTLEDILNYVEPGEPPNEHDAIKVSILALQNLRAWASLFVTQELTDFINRIEEDTDLLVMKKDIFDRMTKGTPILCFRCGKHLGVKRGQTSRDSIAGICDKCLEENYPHLAEVFINSLGDETERYR